MQQFEDLEGQNVTTQYFWGAVMLSLQTTSYSFNALLTFPHFQVKFPLAYSKNWNPTAMKFVEQIFWAI